MSVEIREEQNIKEQARGRVSRRPSVTKREEPSIKEELNAIPGMKARVVKVRVYDSRSPHATGRKKQSIKERIEELKSIFNMKGKVQAVYNFAAADNFAVDRVVREGFPVSFIDEIKKNYPITDAELVNVAGLTLRTFQRKRAERKNLSPPVSDRIARLTSILSFATQLFKDPKLAAAWMRKPQIGLGGQKPIDLIETEAGENAVRVLLGRIKYGVLP